MFARSALRAAQPLKMVCSRPESPMDLLHVKLPLQTGLMLTPSSSSMRAAMLPNLAPAAAPTFFSTVRAQSASLVLATIS